MTEQSVQEQSRTGHAKYLTLQLADEDYALNILQVREIISMMEITTVPRMPEFVRGVINLRGRIVPMIDLRRRFGMTPPEETIQSCIVVAQVQDTEVGLIVDRVLDVLDITDEQVEQTPSLGGTVNLDFIRGIAKTPSRVVLLLNIDRILTDKELVTLPGDAS